MEHFDDLTDFSPLMNVQIHEIKPASKTTSFAALLEKFFLSMEEDRKAASKLDDAIVPAQSLIADKEQQ